MTLAVIGVNHKTASVAMREKIAFDPAVINGALHSIIAWCEVDSCVILSTCNRSEIYLDFDEQDFNLDRVLKWLAKYCDFDLVQIEKSVYQYQDLAAIEHMMQVACGLDSMLLGEPQILGQMKAAFNYAKQAKTLTNRLERAFNATFACAKKVRTETNIGENPVSIAFAAVNLAKQIFSDLACAKVLLIGAGETISLVAKYLYQAKVKQITVANRTQERASELALQLDANSALLGEIPKLLVESDIVISSTAAPLPILGKGAVENALKQRKHSPIFMLDLAVPRDIEVQVGDLADVYLYNVDDLQQLISSNLKIRQTAANKAQEIISGCAQDFMYFLQMQNANDLLRSFRLGAQNIANIEFEIAQKQLRRGVPANQVLSKFKHSLTNKLIHAPTVGMKQLAGKYGDQHLDFAATLLGIKQL